MDDRIGNLSEVGLENAESLFPGPGGKMLGRLLAASADVVLIVDKTGTIKDVSFKLEGLFAGGARAWKGRRVQETVTPESEEKITQLIAEATPDGSTMPRQVNHPMVDTDDIPVSYRSVRIDEQGDVVLFGNSVAEIASMQRRVISAQLAMEREAAKLKAGESRYRAAFRLSENAQILVDAASLRVIDVNPAAATLTGTALAKLESRKLQALFEDKDGTVLHKMLMAAIKEDKVEAAHVSLSNGRNVRLRLSHFPQGGQSLLLLHMFPAGREVSEPVDSIQFNILDLTDGMPDAFIVTDSDHSIINANKSFFELFNLSGMKELEGLEFDSFFERPGVDCNVLVSNVKEHGHVRRFASSMKTRFGQHMNVEIAACQHVTASGELLGFWIRPANNVVMDAEAEHEKVTPSNEQIADLVGHMSLKEIVRETARMIEVLCIETALELTKNNRASAAQMLGISRQSLYSKLDSNKDKI
ncbi:MAG: transcriptional regulator PpsR [Pseudomonadota bacterium]